MRIHLTIVSCGVLLVAPALASETTVHLGDATITYDDARWSVASSPTALYFEPLGKDRHLDPVSLQVTDSDETCDVLAGRAFPPEHYDLRELGPSPVLLGGVAGVRMAAHTRCRNATPVGVAACARVNGRAYVLQSVQMGCRGRNLFSGVDPLEEIGGGLSFERAAR